MNEPEYQKLFEEFQNNKNKLILDIEKARIDRSVDENHPILKPNFLINLNTDKVAEIDEKLRVISDKMNRSKVVLGTLEKKRLEKEFDTLLDKRSILTQSFIPMNL